MKKILAGISIAMMALVFTNLAHAASISNISDDSYAKIFNSWLASITLKNTNTAAITNTVTATSNTGYNTVTSEDDQTGTVIKTGDANTGSVVDNAANKNVAVVSVESSAASADNITNIGDESTAKIWTTDTVTTTETNDNAVAATNDISTDSQTGTNTVVSGDSLNGTNVTTGLAQVVSGLSNAFNLNIQKITRTLRSF